MSETNSQPTGSPRRGIKRWTVPITTGVIGFGALFAQVVANQESSVTEQQLAIFAGVAAKDVAALRSTIDQHPSAVRDRDLDGNTLLHVATSLGWREGVDLLIERGADVNAPNDRGSLPLALALNARRTEQQPIVSALLRAGASPEAKLADGKSVRQFAATLKPADPKAVALLSK